MELQLKASLKAHLQKWLDDNADDIGSKEGICQDDTNAEMNAALMTNACEVVIDAMRLQSELRDKFEDMP